MKLPDDAIHALLRRWPVARLATLTASGRPHQVPIVFVRIGERIWSPVDGKPKQGDELARLRNLRTRSEASLLLDAYAEDWSQLWWLRIDAVGSVVDAGDLGPEEVGALVAALRAKYPQYRETPVLRDPPTLLRFEPHGMQSWCASRDAIPAH